MQITLHRYCIYVLNLSLHDQCVPSLWKLANVRPIMKESTLSDCSQLRPISLTNIIMRFFENIVFQEEIEEHSKSIISNDQFAYKKRVKYNYCPHQMSVSLAEMAG